MWTSLSLNVIMRPTIYVHTSDGLRSKTSRLSSNDCLNCLTCSANCSDAMFTSFFTNSELRALIWCNIGPNVRCLRHTGFTYVSWRGFAKLVGF